MLLALALLSALQLTPATDSLTGKWQVTGDVQGNPVKVTCNFTQAGTALTGTCGDDANGPSPLTGEIKEGKVRFQYGVDYQGQPLTIIYEGTFASPTLLKGTIDVKPMSAMGTFSATPAPPKP